jgi:hypothetical protein
MAITLREIEATRPRKTEDNAICGSSGLSIIGFMQVIEKLMGGLFASKINYQWMQNIGQ